MSHPESMSEFEKELLALLRRLARALEANEPTPQVPTSLRLTLGQPREIP